MYIADCSDIVASEETPYDAPHIIQPEGAPQPFPALCMFYNDNATGWTVLQNHFTSRDHWDKDWREYRDGFGMMSLTSMYW